MLSISLKVRNGTLPPVNRRIISILSDILAASQEFMRNQKVITVEIFVKTDIEYKYLIVFCFEISYFSNKDECSFVSLRDVERTLKVFGWMYNQKEIFDAMDEVELEEQSDDEDTAQPAASVNI